MTIDDPRLIDMLLQDIDDCALYASKRGNDHTAHVLRRAAATICTLRERLAEETARMAPPAPASPPPGPGAPV